MRRVHRSGFPRGAHNDHMGYHTYDVEAADRLEDASFRYRYLSMEELLGHLRPSTDDTVVDLGSGTGFYTDDVSPRAAEVYAVDVQEGMHEYYRAKPGGVPENVTTVTASVDDLPLGDSSVDLGFTTMTYHEFASEEALAEVRRVLSEDARLVVADWTSEGDGEAGPSVDERYSADEAVAALEGVGFETVHTEERTETFVTVAV